MTRVIIRLDGAGPELHYVFGADGEGTPERGVIRAGGEHRNFDIEGNAALTITADPALIAELAGDPQPARDPIPPQPQPDHAGDGAQGQ